MKSICFKLIYITLFSILLLINEEVIFANECLLPLPLEDLFSKARTEYLLGNFNEAHCILQKIPVFQKDRYCFNDLNFRTIKGLNREASNNRSTTRRELLKAVDLAWQRPEPIESQKPIHQEFRTKEPILELIACIKIPQLHFIQANLSSVIAMLSELSVVHDTRDLPYQEKGINFVLIDDEEINPKVTISLRNLTLKQILEVICRATHFSYEIINGIITFSPGSIINNYLVTEFFAIPRATVARLTASSLLMGTPEGEASLMEEEAALKCFFEKAGIPFDPLFGGTLGAQFAFDGTQIIVTQTPQNLQKIGLILDRYKETRQVEIEAKFMEVQEGVLEELGLKWNISSKSNPNPFFQSFSNKDGASGNNLRTLNDAFKNQGISGDGNIILDTIPSPTTKVITNQPPSIPNGLPFGSNSVPFSGILGVLGTWQMNVIVNALEQHTGSDLMSAPKVTVLSGKTAQITVAQTLRYPESFGDIRSAVGTAGSTPESSAAGVTITAGTPRNFIEKNIGVEMKVTPTVEFDDHNINLKLEPKVTEFEGFIEYGGKSIAVSGKNNIVEVPSGFFQPIFSKREIITEVTIENGSTVVMGGLTREEIKQVHDKVPFLGDLPLIGRLFRSKGETNQKKNLLIFVMANIISSGGSIIEARPCIIPEDTAYKNPVIISAGGTIDRKIL